MERMKKMMTFLTVLAFFPAFMAGCEGKQFKPGCAAGLVVGTLPFLAAVCIEDEDTPPVDLPASCTNGKMDNGELGVDCGGTCVKACANPEKCTIPADCSSGMCSDGKCMPPTCSDKVQNQGEQGVDCGGPCTACKVEGNCPIKGMLPKPEMSCTEPYVFKDAILEYKWGINGKLVKHWDITYMNVFRIDWGSTPGIGSGELICSGKDCWGDCGENATKPCFRQKMTDDAGQHLVIERFESGKDPFTDRPDRKVMADREDTF